MTNHYRYLTKDDVLLNGDEVYYGDDKWMPVIMNIGVKVRDLPHEYGKQSFRRPIVPLDASDECVDEEIEALKEEVSCANYIWIAESIIRSAFNGVTDKGGMDYIDHILRVASRFSGLQKVAALLHDLLEDCPWWTFAALRDLFPKEVCDAVLAITKTRNESYGKYIDRLMENQWAVEIKIADLEDNMNITRLPVFGEKDIDRLKKYHETYLLLKAL